MALTNVWQILPWRCRECGARYGLLNLSNVNRTASGECCVCDRWDRPAVARRGEGATMGSRTGNGGSPAQSPLYYAFDDYRQNILSVTMVFDNTSRLITGCTVYRDADCLWRHLLVGLGEDGVPDSSPRSFAVPVGTTNVPVSTLNVRGLTTIEDFLGYQLTAGL